MHVFLSGGLGSAQSFSCFITGNLHRGLASGVSWQAIACLRIHKLL